MYYNCSVYSCSLHQWIMKSNIKGHLKRIGEQFYSLNNISIHKRKQSSEFYNEFFKNKIPYYSQNAGFPTYFENDKTMSFIFLPPPNKSASFLRRYGKKGERWLFF